MEVFLKMLSSPGFAARCILLAGLVHTGVSEVHATSYRALAFGEVLPRADLVVTGTVVRPQTDPRDETFLFRVDDVLSGSLAQGAQVTVNRRQVRRGKIRSAHTPGQELALFLAAAPSHRWPPHEADFEVVGLDAEGEFPLVDERVFLTGLRTRHRSPGRTQTTDVLGVRLDGHPVDPEVFAHGIRTYPETRRDLLAAVAKLRPCTAEAMTSAADAISHSQTWNAGFFSSPLFRAIRDSILGEAEQAFRGWELTRKIPSYAAPDVQQLLADCTHTDTSGSGSGTGGRRSQSSAPGESRDSRDAAVLEAALIDLLTSSDSPVEGKKDAPEQILFSMTPRSAPVSSETLLKSTSDRPQNPPLELIPEAREAALDLIRRTAEKDLFTTFPLSDPRIVLQPDEPARPGTGEEHEGYFRERPQVFRANPPGYSSDGRVAMVHVGFPWSGNMHSGLATIVLVRRDGKWVPLTRDFIYFV